MFRVPERLYYTADRSRLVKHGDPTAAFLAFIANQELSDEEALRFGLTQPVVAVETLDNAPVEKQRPRPLDKAAARPADKGISKAPLKETAS